MNMFSPALQQLRRRTWNACWFPLQCIHEVAAPALPEPTAAVMEWDVCDQVSGKLQASLSAEIISAFVLPMLEAQDLLATLQPLSMAHSFAVREEVVGKHRAEQMALIFSEAHVWLTDGCLGTRCQQLLPFRAAFAHVACMPEASSVLVAPKMDASQNQMWAVTILRRSRSLRFQLQVHPLHAGSVPPAPWHSGVTVGMAAGPERKFYRLLSSHRLSCCRLQLEQIQVAV